MRLESVRELKQQLLQEVVAPFVARMSQLHKLGAAAVTSASAAAGIEARPAFGIGCGPVTTVPRLQRSIALGISRHQDGYRVAVRIQRPGLIHSPQMERINRQAKGEVDVRLIGRIDKRVKARRATQKRRVMAALRAARRSLRGIRPIPARC